MCCDGKRIEVRVQVSGFKFQLWTGCVNLDRFLNHRFLDHIIQRMITSSHVSTHTCSLQSINVYVIMSCLVLLGFEEVGISPVHAQWRAAMPEHWDLWSGRKGLRPGGRPRTGTT